MERQHSLIEGGMELTASAASFGGSFAMTAAPTVPATRPEEVNNRAAAAAATANNSSDTPAPGYESPHNGTRIAKAMKYLIGFDHADSPESYTAQYQLLKEGKLYAPWQEDKPLVLEPVDGAKACEMALAAGCVATSPETTRSGNPFSVDADNYLNVARTLLPSGVVSPLFLILATYPVFNKQCEEEYDITFPNGDVLPINMNDLFAVNQILLICMREDTDFDVKRNQLLAKTEILQLLGIWIAMQLPVIFFFKEPTYVTHLLATEFDVSHVSELFHRHPVHNDCDLARTRELARSAVAVETASILHMNDMSDEAKQYAMQICNMYLGLDYCNASLHYIAINCDEAHRMIVSGRYYTPLHGILAGQVAEAHNHKMEQIIQDSNGGQAINFEDSTDALFLQYDRPLMRNGFKIDTFVSTALCCVGVVGLHLLAQKLRS